MEWLNWMSQYYFYPLGLVAGSCFQRYAVQKKRKPQPAPAQTPSKLNSAQLKCTSEIKKTAGFKVHLLHGVTGSGKTEVYLDLITNVIQKTKVFYFFYLKSASLLNYFREFHRVFRTKQP